MDKITLQCLSKIWKRFYVLVNDEFCGELQIEPEKVEERYQYFANGELSFAPSLKKIKEIITLDMIQRDRKLLKPPFSYQWEIAKNLN
jgi:hypothetical protein